jgi:hypothetical protein
VEGDSSELHDSVTRSEETGTRESSEVQSSSSLSKTRRTRRRKDVSGGDVTPGNEDMAMVKSEPLVGVLEMIKRHEKFSLFERRLEKNQVLQFSFHSFSRGQNRYFVFFQKFERKNNLVFSSKCFFIIELIFSKIIVK